MMLLIEKGTFVYKTYNSPIAIVISPTNVHSKKHNIKMLIAIEYKTTPTFPQECKSIYYTNINQQRIILKTI